MLLTSKEIKEKSILLESEYSKYNQTGVDLSVKSFEKIIGGIVVNKNNTDTSNLEYEFVILEDGYYNLLPGAYAVEFNEGVTLPSNVTGKITTRSSLYRGGSHINSPLWDPGFSTINMGTTLIVEAPIKIEVNSRIAQMFFMYSEEVEELYDGQFQGKVNKK